MLPIPLLFLTLIIVICYLLHIALKRIKTTSFTLEKVIVISYIFSLFLFASDLFLHSNQYNITIDLVDGACYIPFGEKHIYSLLFYFIAFNISTFLIWTRLETSTNSESNNIKFYTHWYCPEFYCTYSNIWA